MKYLVLLSLALVCASSVFGQQATQQSKSFMFKPKIETYSLSSHANLSLNSFNQEEGIPPALLIIGGGALFLAGALTSPQGSGSLQVLMMAGGLGLATAGFVVAFGNSQNDNWE